MSLELTWGVLIVGLAIAASLYGISTAQTFYYYRTYAKDPLYTRILTGTVCVLNTAHLGFIIHMLWYYLILGEGGTNNAKVVWSWPSSVILTALISLPIYSFYAHRMRILGAHSSVCVIVLILGLAHFTLKMAFCIKVLVGGHVSILAAPDTIGLLYGSFGIGTATDLGIALVMCWLLSKARTGHSQTDDMVTRIMVYTVKSGLLIALCMVAGLVSGLVAANTQFQLFFLFILPELYANSYLGSLNNRKAIRAHLSASQRGTQSQSAYTYSLGGLRSPPLTPMTPSTVVCVERTTVYQKDDYIGSPRLVGFDDRKDMEAQAY